MTALTVARAAMLREWRVPARDTHRKPAHFSWAYQTGAAQGRPAPSAVARGRDRLEAMICLAPAAGPGSLASRSDVTGAPLPRDPAVTDLEVVLPGGTAID